MSEFGLPGDVAWNALKTAQGLSNPDWDFAELKLLISSMSEIIQRSEDDPPLFFPFQPSPLGVFDRAVTNWQRITAIEWDSSVLNVEVALSLSLKRVREVRDKLQQLLDAPSKEESKSMMTFCLELSNHILGLRMEGYAKHRNKSQAVCNL